MVAGLERAVVDCTAGSDEGGSGGTRSVYESKTGSVRFLGHSAFWGKMRHDGVKLCGYGGQAEQE